MAVPSLSALTNPSSLIPNLNLSSFMTGVQWLLVGIVAVCAFGGFAWWYFNRKAWTKKITVLDIVNGYYQPVANDVARLVALGSGGFQVLYLKKLKVYRVGYGGRIGKDTYWFAIARDGYWYNCLLGSQLTTEGKIQIVVANPAMRSQYTALEKQIEALHGAKVTFWDKYGTWVFGIAYLLIMGIFAYLFFQQYSNVVKETPDMIKQMSNLVNTVNQLLISSGALHGTINNTAQLFLGLIK